MQIKYLFFCPKLVKRRNTSFSVSLPNSKPTTLLILFKNMTLLTTLIQAVSRMGELFPFACSASFKEHKELGLPTSLVNAF